MIKILVTNIIYEKINYLILTNFKKNSFIDVANTILSKLGEAANDVYSTFETVIVNSSLRLSTVHSILSPIDTSIILAIVAGRVVLTELFDVDPLLIFVFCLNNNAITSIMFLFIIIFVVIAIYNLLVKTIFKKVTFIY